MDFQTIRLYGSLAIIGGCFIFLYPKLLHPIVMAPFGGVGSSEKKVEKDFIPPPLRDKHPHIGNRDVHDHAKMRHGPHPGMRAAAAEQSRQSTKGSGRGMMGVILPMYAIGIVVYLAYTLFKVFNKKEEKSKRSPSSSPERRPMPPELSLPPQESDEGRVSASVDKALTQDELSKHLHDLHELADRVQENDMKLDMRKLQQRLAETESQMSKILAAMQAVQTKVGSAETSTKDVPSPASPQTKQEGQSVPTEGQSKAKAGSVEKESTTGSSKEGSKDDRSNNQGQETGVEDASTEACNVSEGSSHDSESYEIISPSERDSSQGEVETVHSVAEAELRDQQGEKPTEEVEEVILKDKEETEEEDGQTNVRKRVPRADN